MIINTRFSFILSSRGRVIEGRIVPVNWIKGFYTKRTKKILSEQLNSMLCSGSSEYFRGNYHSDQLIWSELIITKLLRRLKNVFINTPAIDQGRIDVEKPIFRRRAWYPKFLLKIILDLIKPGCKAQKLTISYLQAFEFVAVFA